MSLDENATRGNAAASPAPRLALLPSPGRGIRLWWCALHATKAELESCRALLSPAEHARAARFGMPLLRERYVVGRAALRQVLARTLGLAPADIPIVRGSRGRPQLDGAPLDFNVSHTHDVVLIGVIAGAGPARIGVDVERLDRRINVTGIARKFLSGGERAALAALAPDAARRHVLALWTCKEAMSKATGDALSAPFAAIDVELTGEPLLREGPGPYAPAQWSLHRAQVPSDYVATVAVWRR